MRSLFPPNALFAPLRNRLSPLPLGIALLTLSALYLALPARDRMDSAAALAILLHIGLGLLLIIPVGLALVRRLQRTAAEASGRRAILLTILLIGFLCALTGVYLTLRAAFGHSAAHDSLMSVCHIAASIAALLLAVGFKFLSASKHRPRNPETAATPNAALSFLPILLLILLLAQGALWGAAALLPEYKPEEYYRDLTATNAEQAQNPLFPAGLRLQDADGTEPKSPVSWNLPSSAACGRAGCHVSAYREWQASGHHFAGTDVFYQAVLQQYAAKSGRQAALWCQGCHAPQAVLAASESQVQSGKIEAAASEGVSCYACHAAVGTPTRTGNGHFVLAEPQDYPFGNAGGWQRGLHDFLLRVRPGPHQRAYLKPELHGASEFCSSCHRQSFSVAQNHYQFLRGPDEYGEWQSSPFSGRAARAPVWNAPPAQTCQDCHFPPQAAGHYRHDAPGGNTALPALRGDNSRLAQTEAYLREKISLDIFALRRQPDANQGEQWIAPLDNPPAPYSLHPGETWTLDILVSNRGVGHNFPSGYADIKEAWLELRLTDSSGRPLLANGLLTNPAADLLPDTHIFTALGLDRAGMPITRHNLTEQVTTVYRRSIASGSSDVARYNLTLPRQSADGKPLTGSLHLSARLRYRSLRPDFARWALSAAPAGNRRADAAFTPPVTTLAEAALSLPLQRPAPGTKNRSAAENREQSERFIRYGNALLAPTEKPDVSRALRAFRVAEELAPERTEPALGIGKIFLLEPDLRLAAANFTKVLKKDPQNSAAAANLSVVYNKQGQHELAIQTIQPLLTRFPQDGKLQFDYGLALFKAGRYEPAAEAFQRALAADPDDPAAHFQLKRCYEVMRKVSQARREDSITRYLAEDKLAPLLVPRYLAFHAKERLSAQPFPVHTLRPVYAPTKSK